MKCKEQKHIYEIIVPDCKSCYSLPIPNLHETHNVTQSFGWDLAEQFLAPLYETLLGVLLKLNESWHGEGRKQPPQTLESYVGLVG
jgi:hypothetical protein